MREPIRCPICRDALMVAGERDHVKCLTCDFRAPRHVATLIAAERFELGRLRRVLESGEALTILALNDSLRMLAETLRDQARAADRAAAVADDAFDVPTRDNYRGRALSYRVSAALVEELAPIDEPKVMSHG